MALAQRKDRQAYNWGNDPRNTFWANDDSKFGQRMMEKMGWNQGDGLGKTRSGTRTHIKVKKKSNFNGIGADERTDYNWLMTQDAYSSVLASLNQELTKDGMIKIDDSQPAAQEAKPVVTNQRRSLLYSRFKKAKNLNSYSQDDLKSILGAEDKRPADLVKTDAPEQVEEQKDEQNGLTTITRKESVADYFAAKLAARKAKSKGAVSTVTSTLESSVAAQTAAARAPSDTSSSASSSSAENMSEPRSVRGKKRKHDDSDQPDANGRDDGSSKSGKKTKKRKKEKPTDSNGGDSQERETSTLKKTKKKKSKKGSKDKDERSNKSNASPPSSHDDVAAGSSSSTQLSSDPIEQQQQKKKLKKSKKDKKQREASLKATSPSSSKVAEDTSTPKSKSKKRKSKSKKERGGDKR